MRIELRSFRIHEHSDVDGVAEELDEAFKAGWRFLAQLHVGRGSVLVLERFVEHSNGADPPIAEPSARRARAGAKA